MFKEQSKFGLYSGKGYLNTFLASLEVELESVLIAKGIKITGPYDELDVMTFSQKKNVDLILTPQVVLNVDEQYRVNRESRDWVEREGTIILSGAIYFTLLEPLSQEKLWIKKVKFPSHNAFIETDLLITNGELNPLHPCKDNSDAVFVDILNKIYPEIMEKFWSYLDPDELNMLKQESKTIRKRKVY